MPTIPIEETDYGAGSGALSGERVFKNTVPATTAREQTFNTLWHNLRKIITEMGVSNDLSVANYATDLAAGFPNLSKAIRRLARRSRSAEVQTILATSGDHLFTLTSDKHIYLIDNDGSGPYGEGSVIYINHANPTQDSYRTILVQNVSGEAKLVVDAINSSATAWLEDQESCLFVGLVDSGSGNLYWSPLGRELHTYPIAYDVKLYDAGAHATMSSTFQLNYIAHGPGKKLVTLDFSGATITMSSGSGTIEVAPAAGFGALSSDVVPVHGTEASPFSSPFILIYAEGSVSGMQVLRVVYRNSNMHIQKLLGSSFAVGEVVAIPAFSWTFRKP